MPNPLPLLETDYVNAPYAHDGTESGWESAVCGNQTFPLTNWAWMQILNEAEEYDSPVVGLSGTAFDCKPSPTDFPFTHPFGGDFECFIAPDPAFVPLLAYSNRNPNDPDYLQAKTTAINALGPDVPGTIGLEVDEAFVPPSYQPTHLDRVAVFGRWIIDCGHGDYHSEIHPPLLLAVARQPKLEDGTPDPDRTASTVIGRPYLVGQQFDFGGTKRAFRDNLLAQILILGIPGAQAFARPEVSGVPFRGKVSIRYVLKPPSPRESPDDTLFVSFHFTVRTGITIHISNNGQDSVSVAITMDDAAYKPAALPNKSDVRFSPGDLLAVEFKEWGEEIGQMLKPVLGANPLLGIITDRYTSPQPSSPGDGKTKFTNVPVSSLALDTPVNVDDNQPFPIYGSLDLAWSRSQGVPTSLVVGDWSIDANGFTGTLRIHSVDSKANVNAEVFENKTSGFWDEESKTLVFVRIIEPADPSTFQVFTGYLFANPGTAGSFSLSGSFEAFKGTGATASRSVFGWFAQITIPG